MKSSRYPIALTALLSFLVAGCLNGKFEQNFSTEFEVVHPGLDLDVVAVTKWFRFSRDPADADEVTLKNCSLRMLAPTGQDFAFLERLDVYAVLEDQSILIASSGEFIAGAAEIPLNIEYEGDLRPFTRDKRVYLTFVALLSPWFTTWPAEGFEVQANVTLEVVLF